MNRDQLRSLARELKGLGVKEAFGYGLSTDLSKSELEADLQDCVREIHVAGRAVEFEKKLTKGQAREAWNELSSAMKALKEEEGTPKKTMFKFLDGLRESEAINMFGAAPHLAEAFNLDKKESRAVLKEWMETFSERHKEESTKESRTAAARVVGVAKPEPEEEEPKEITIEEALVEEKVEPKIDLNDHSDAERAVAKAHEEKPKRAKANRIHEDMTICIVEEKAPKRPGTIAWANFEQYRKHPIVKDFLEKSGVDRPRAALAFDRYHGRVILK